MKPKKSKGLVVTLIVLGVLIVSLVGVLITYNQLLQPVTTVSEEVSFVVKQGSTLTSVLSDLEDEGIIRNAQVAKINLQLSPVDSNLKAGEFVIDKAWTLKEMLEYMSDGNNTVKSVKRITFIEGKWARDYAQQLEKELNISASELLELWNNEEYLNELIDRYEVLTQEILNPDTFVKLEGYLAPNTYEFFLDASPKQVTETFLNQTELIYKANKEAFDSSEFSIHEIFTLASIIQFEAGSEQDNPLVASVFINRLHISMRLESSVTVCYALYDYDSWLECETNIKIDSPYNTYVIDGIPIGPVSNSGESALRSVLYPVTSDYYYFVNDVYGDHSVHFAKTYAEHVKNVNEYLRGR